MKTSINQVRSLILSVEQDVLGLKAIAVATDLDRREGIPQNAAPADRGEMIANCMLAYRHLEDARMRLGKMIQAFDGGVSVYDKKP